MTEPVEQVTHEDRVRQMFYGTVGRPGPAGHVLSAADLAGILNVHKNTVLKWIDSGELRAYKTGKQWRIITGDAIAYVLENSNVKD